MTSADVPLDALLDILDRAGAEVRREHLDGAGGGLCKLKGKLVFFVDLDADECSVVQAAAGALAKLPQIESVYLSPNIREQIQRAAMQGG